MPSAGLRGSQDAFKENWLRLNLYERFEQVIAVVVTALVSVIVVVAVVDLFKEHDFLEQIHDGHDDDDGDERGHHHGDDLLETLVKVQAQPVLLERVLTAAQSCRWHLVSRSSRRRHGRERRMRFGKA